MNNKIVVIAGVIISFAVVAVSGYSAAAQSEQAVLSDTHIQRIQQNCKTALRVIQQIHVNDAPLRINRAQVYDSISSKLMTPLNGRLIVNKLDASAMVKTTAEYQKTLADFIASYYRYDNKMSDVLTINCVKEPQRFYDELSQARQMRTVVHNNVIKINGLIDEYGASFSAFKERFLSGEMGSAE